jgi:hypothetical protein
MAKYIGLFIVIFYLLSCSKKDEIVPLKTYKFTLDSVLTQSGTNSLFKDDNGYFHLKLIPNKNQSVHRITGRILVNDKEPVPAEKIEWESNLYWYLKRNDTVAYIYKSYINYYTGKFTIVKLPPLISSKDELVSTINPASYSGKNGEINIMIAPVYTMKGDTMVVQASNYSSKLTKTLKIVLE